MTVEDTEEACECCGGLRDVSKMCHGRGEGGDNLPESSSISRTTHSPSSLSPAPASMSASSSGSATLSAQEQKEEVKEMSVGWKWLHG